ncbi:septum formation family protein [Rhodococcus marinonascens]|uniref:septum formation family protein n=1 Tax=Rhodococcus marinonascens TaxID=38311 RepID=UPI0009331C33|nr:septum formation family protein [Rhodococcus marinonascens]
MSSDQSNGAEPQPQNVKQSRKTLPRMSAPTTRRALAAVAVGAVVAAVATIAISDGFNRSEKLPALSSGSGAQATSVEGVAFASATVGDCLDWTSSTESGGDRTDVAKVDCSQEHRFEVTSALDLSVYPGAEFGPGSRYPGALRFAVLRDEHCVPAVGNYLGANFDPNGKFSVGLMFPSESGWAAGERTLRCGLQFSSTAGTLLPFTGRVGEQDQSNIWDPGSCIGISQGVPTDPVDCAQPHAFEVISVVDLATRFPGPMPSVEDQDEYLEDVCTQASNEYLGSADALRDKTLTLFWDNLGLDSWLAGSRRINCSIGKETDSGFSTVTGSAKGEILIDGVAPVPPPPIGEGRSIPTPLPGAAPLPGA